MSHILNYLITAETRRAHRARWFVYGGPYGEKIRLKAGVSYTGAGYDVECSCGWASRTGGATRASVEDALWDHRHFEQANAETSPSPSGEAGCRAV